MNKEFILYEQALALKELGFDEPCFAWFILESDRAKRTLVLEKCPKQNIGLCLAPTFSQSFRFFREKYGLEGTPQRAEDFMWYKWIIHLYNENGKKYVANWYEYETYEEAELACLIKLIEITKQQ